MIFQTERLIIRLLKETDIAGFYDMHRNPKVMQYVTGDVEDLATAQKNVQSCIECYAKPSNDFWIYAIDEKATGEFIGTLAIIKTEKGEDEIGYRFREKFWGNGFATETMLGTINHCFEELKYESLYTVADVKNVASIKILEKFFTFQREFFNKEEKCTDREYRLRNPNQI